jgi:hypothetical protein
MGFVLLALSGTSNASIHDALQRARLRQRSGMTR